MTSGMPRARNGDVHIGWLELGLVKEQKVGHDFGHRRFPRSASGLLGFGLGGFSGIGSAGLHLVELIG